MIAEFALLAAAAACVLAPGLWLARVAIHAAERAQRYAHAADLARAEALRKASDLQGELLRLDRMDDRLESLRSQHQRLHGKFHATLRTATPAEPEAPETPEQIRERLRQANGLPRIGPARGDE